MAETIVYVQEHGYDTRDDLEKQYKEILSKGQRAKSALNAVSAELKVTNMQLKHLGSYYANRRIHNQMTKELNKKKFREEHQKELTAFDQSQSMLSAPPLYALISLPLTIHSFSRPGAGCTASSLP